MHKKYRYYLIVPLLLSIIEYENADHYVATKRIKLKHANKIDSRVLCSWDCLFHWGERSFLAKVAWYLASQETKTIQSYNVNLLYNHLLPSHFEPVFSHPLSRSLSYFSISIIGLIAVLTLLFFFFPVENLIIDNMINYCIINRTILFY